MIGERGEAELALALRAALTALLDAFPEHLPSTHPPDDVDVDARSLAERDQFDAILRAHRKNRLGLPIHALRATGAAYHGLTRARPRRLAWFVPSLLASWLDRAPGAGDAVFGPDDVAAIVDEAVGDDDDDAWTWTDEEAAALDTFFLAALDAALAEPLRPARDPAAAAGRERPLEDGIRVWSLCSPSVPLEVLRMAKALHVSLDPLVAHWALKPGARALDHLLEAVYDTIVPAKHYLSDEAVADRLGDAFFEATGERQQRLSKAEATVRRNILRRTDL